MSEKRKGRPTLAEQIEIKNNIMRYYLQDVDPKTTKELTGYDIKTIRKYFNMWNEQNQKSYDKSFFEKSKERKQKAIMRFNLQISKLDKMSGVLENKIKQSEGEITKEFVQGMKLWQETEKMITVLTLHVVNMGNSPTTDVSFATQADEMVIKNYGIHLSQ